MSLRVDIGMQQVDRNETRDKRQSDVGANRLQDVCNDVHLSLSFRSNCLSLFVCLVETLCLSENTLC